MKNKFCPGCGKETDKLIKGMCSECYSERNEIVKLPDKIEIANCNACGRFKKNNKWLDIGFNEVLEHKIHDNIENSGDLLEIDVKLEEIDKDELHAEITTVNDIDGTQMESVNETKIVINRGICDVCSKISSGYYEAILQIRGNDQQIEDSLDIIEEIVKNNDSDMGFVSNVEHVTNGVDLYMGSKSLAKNASRKLSEKFNTINKSSKTIYGLDDGEKIYRSTYLVKFTGKA